MIIKWHSGISSAASSVGVINVGPSTGSATQSLVLTAAIENYTLLSLGRGEDCLVNGINGSVNE